MIFGGGRPSQYRVEVGEPDPRTGKRKTVRVPSVTTILSRYKDSGNLIEWAWSKGKAGVDYKELRDSAAETGHDIHDAWEKYLRGGNVDQLHDSLVPTEEKPKPREAFRALVQWHSDNFNCSYIADYEVRPAEIHAVEMPLVSPTLMVGGTADLVCRLPGYRAPGGLSMDDVKTGNGVYSDVIAQLGAYALMWEEAGHEPITAGGRVLHASAKTGKLKVYHFTMEEILAGGEYFVSLLLAHNREKAVKAAYKRATGRD